MIHCGSAELDAGFTEENIPVHTTGINSNPEENNEDAGEPSDSKICNYYWTKDPKCKTKK